MLNVPAGTKSGLPADTAAAIASVIAVAFPTPLSIWPPRIHTLFNLGNLIGGASRVGKAGTTTQPSNRDHPLNRDHERIGAWPPSPRRGPWYPSALCCRPK